MDRNNCSMRSITRACSWVTIRIIMNESKSEMANIVAIFCCCCSFSATEVLIGKTKSSPMVFNARIMEGGILKTETAILQDRPLAE